MPTEYQLDISLESQLEFKPDLTPPPMTPISKDLQEQIEREARDYMVNNNINGPNPITPDRLYWAYEAGATEYAHYKERFEQAKKALEMIGKPIEHNDANLAIYTRQEIANRLLASWKGGGNG